MKERKRESVCVRKREREKKRERVCVYIRERERNRVSELSFALPSK